MNNIKVVILQWKYINGEYFEMVFLEILPSANMAGFPRTGHMYYIYARIHNMLLA